MAGVEEIQNIVAMHYPKGGEVIIKGVGNKTLKIGAGIAAFLSDIAKEGINLDNLTDTVNTSYAARKENKREWLTGKLSLLGLVKETQPGSRVYVRTDVANNADYEFKPSDYQRTKETLSR